MKITRSIVSLFMLFTLMLTAITTAQATVPVATSFSTTVPANRQSILQLQGADAEGTALTFSIQTSAAHGALSGLNTSTGVVVYTPAAGYTGGDSFTYRVTSGGENSSNATVTISVTNAKTRIIDTLTDPSGAPRQGKVTFILTQVTTTPSGIVPAGASVSAPLDSNGKFDISVYPSRALQPAAYYQVKFTDINSLREELIGIYDIPASTSTSISLAGYKVTDTNLAAQYTFVSVASLQPFISAISSAAIANLLAGSHTDNKLQRWRDANGFVDAPATFTDTLLTLERATRIEGNTTVVGSVTASSYTGIRNEDVPAALSGKTLSTSTLNSPTVSGTVAGSFSLSGNNTFGGVTTFNGNTIFNGTNNIVNGLSFNSPTITGLVGGTPSFGSGVSFGGNTTVNGTVTALNFVGNGAGITGLTGATGGIANTGSTTIEADDGTPDGVGIIDLQTRNISRVQVANNGDVGIGIVPTARLHLPSNVLMRFGADGVGGGGIRFPTIYAGREFSISESVQHPGDPVLETGYNSYRGSKIDPTDASFSHTIEGDYLNSSDGQHYFESNTGISGVNGTNHRLQYFSVKRQDASGGLWAWAGDNFWFGETGLLDPNYPGTPQFVVNVPNNYGYIKGSFGIGVTNPGSLSLASNRVVIPNNTYYSALTSAGTSVLGLIGLNASDRVLLGGLVSADAFPVTIPKRLKIGEDAGTTAALTIYGPSGSEDAQKIRLGFSPDFDYSIYRDPLTGGMNFRGTQTGVVQYTFNGPLLPSADNQYAIGSSGARWSLVRAVTITPGDLILSDRTTGQELYKIHEDPVQGIFFDDYRTGERLMRLDRDGNLHLKGNVIPNSN